MLAALPAEMTPAQFVDKLFVNAAVTPTAQRRVQRAEMVRDFIVSEEYRKRFGR